MKKLLALAFVCSALSAHAGIGETKIQVEKRYGKPIKMEIEKGTDFIGDLVLFYQWKGYNILVTYIGGRSEYEKISREDDKRILIPEIEDLLKFQKDGFKREKVVDDQKADRKLWETANGDRAVYMRDRVSTKRSEYALYVTSRKYEDFEAAQKARSKVK